MAITKLSRMEPMEPRMCHGARLPSKRAKQVLLLLVFWLVNVESAPASAVSHPTEEAPESTPDLDSYSGIWVRIENDRERASLRDSIDRAADSFPLLFRVIARATMHSRIQPRNRIAIVPGEGDGTLEIGADLLRLDGTTYKSTRANGAAVTRLTCLKNGAIDTQWKQADSHGSRVYRISEDGRTLTVLVTIHTEYVQVPIAYTATYRRSERKSAILSPATKLDMSWPGTEARRYVTLKSRQLGQGVAVQTKQPRGGGIGDLK